MVHSPDPDVRLISQIDIVMCFIYSISGNVSISAISRAISLRHRFNVRISTGIFPSCFYLIICHYWKQPTQLWSCSKLSIKRPEQLSKSLFCFSWWSFDRFNTSQIRKTPKRFKVEALINNNRQILWIIRDAYKTLWKI